MKNFRRLIKRIGLYPPYLGMGIRLHSHADDFTRFDVQLVERWYTRNLFGTHFGGSLFAMSDPFYVFIITLNFGRGYIIWDKSAEIDFVKPAKGTITGIFEIDKDTLTAMQSDVDDAGKRTFHFSTELRDEDGQTVARVRKEVYVRSKARQSSSENNAGDKA